MSSNHTHTARIPKNRIALEARSLKNVVRIGLKKVKEFSLDRGIRLGANPATTDSVELSLGKEGS